METKGKNFFYASCEWPGEFVHEAPSHCEAPMLVACTCDATNTVHKELVFVLPTSEYAELRPDKKDADEAKWLKLLKTENARLKKMLVERDLEIEVLKETNASRCAKSKD